MSVISLFYRSSLYETTYLEKDDYIYFFDYNVFEK